MEDRLERLESKMMACEDQLDELNRCVWRQEQELEHLRAQLRLLAERLQAADSAAPALRAEDELPPHW